jgi:hypothetical protein
MCDVISVWIESFVLMRIKQRLARRCLFMEHCFSEELRVGFAVKDMSCWLKKELNAQLWLWLDMRNAGTSSSEDLVTR